MAHRDYHLISFDLDLFELFMTFVHRKKTANKIQKKKDGNMVHLKPGVLPNVTMCHHRVKRLQEVEKRWGLNRKVFSMNQEKELQIR